MTEFGTGFAYNLGLFLAHAERVEHYKKIYNSIDMIREWPDMWFNGAADHLFELQVPWFFNSLQRNAVKDFKEKCVGFRLCFGNEVKPTEEDVTWAIQTAKDLLRELDKSVFIKSKKGDYE